MVILISDFLIDNKSSLIEISAIYVNRGPGSFAGIRNSLSIIKALFLTKNIDYYCFSFKDFDGLEGIEYKDVPNLCKKFKIKKNLINPIYLS
jgi:tRNA threonylcarbamoyladenosine biosynthesis protein TsaB